MEKVERPNNVEDEINDKTVVCERMNEETIQFVYGMIG